MVKNALALLNFNPLTAILNKYSSFSVFGIHRRFCKTGLFSKAAHNTLKGIILLIIPIVFTSCTSSSTFTRGDMEQVIKDICKNEFDINITARETGETVWIYAPFENLIDPYKGISKEAQGKIRYIFLSLKRTMLSIDNPPRFYVFVASNTKDIGMDIFHIGFVPDIVKFEFNFISQKEFMERIVYLVTGNSSAIGDTDGHHIQMADITMGDFISYLILHDLKKIFQTEEIKSFIEAYRIDVVYEEGRITVTLDIMRLKYHPQLTDFSEKAKGEITKYLKIYRDSIPDIHTIIINDIRYDTTEMYTLQELLH